LNVVNLQQQGHRAKFRSSDSATLKKGFACLLLCDRYQDKPLEPEFRNQSFQELISRAAQNINDVSSFFKNWYMENSSLIIQGRTLKDWTQERLNDAAIEPPLSNQPVSVNTNWYTLDAAAKMFHYRKRLVTTVEGLISMAPFESQLGDQVWILFGCSVPVIHSGRMAIISS
jgi:hypothetical protein